MIEEYHSPRELALERDLRISATTIADLQARLDSAQACAQQERNIAAFHRNRGEDMAAELILLRRRLNRATPIEFLRIGASLLLCFLLGLSAGGILDLLRNL